jgi:hypothetical protein
MKAINKLMILITHYTGNLNGDQDDLFNGETTIITAIGSIVDSFFNSLQ